MLCWRVSNLYIRSFLLRPLAGLCICTHRIDMCGGGIKTSGTKMAPPSNCAANTAGAPKKLRVLSPYLQTTLHIQRLSSEDTKIALWQPTVQQAEDSPSGSCTTSKWTGRGRTTCQRNWSLWKKQSHLRSYKFWTNLTCFHLHNLTPLLAGALGRLTRWWRWQWRMMLPLLDCLWWPFTQNQSGSLGISIRRLGNQTLQSGPGWQSKILPTVSRWQRWTRTYWELFCGEKKAARLRRRRCGVDGGVAKDDDDPATMITKDTRDDEGRAVSNDQPEPKCF